MKYAIVVSSYCVVVVVVVLLGVCVCLCDCETINLKTTLRFRRITSCGIQCAMHCVRWLLMKKKTIVYRFSLRNYNIFFFNYRNQCSKRSRTRNAVELLLWFSLFCLVLHRSSNQSLIRTITKSLIKIWYDFASIFCDLCFVYF